MLTIMFCIFMIAIFGRLLVFAVRFTWSMLRCVGTLIFLPITLVVMAFGGLLRLALPLLIVFGIISLFTEPSM